MKLIAVEHDSILIGSSGGRGADSGTGGGGGCGGIGVGGSEGIKTSVGNVWTCLKLILSA